MKQARIHYLVRPGKLIALDETLTLIAEVPGGCTPSVIRKLARSLELAGYEVDWEQSSVSIPTAFAE